MDDSSDDDETQQLRANIQVHVSPEEKQELTLRANEFKQLANASFSAGDYELALQHYTAAINALKQGGMKDPIILANRSATYLALKRYVPACHDAIESAKLDADNWKAHWRQGIALMNMAKKKFRTKQAIDAFERCLRCSSLPVNKRSEVEKELTKAKQRMQTQDDETPPADLSNCAPS